MGKMLEVKQSYYVEDLGLIRGSSRNYRIGEFSDGRFGVYEYQVRRYPKAAKNFDWQRIRTFYSLKDALNYCKGN